MLLLDPRGAVLHLAFQFSYIRTEQATEQATKQASLICLQRSNFGPYTFIKGQRHKGTTQEHRNKGTTHEQRDNTGTKEQRETGTKEQRNKTNKRTWELGNLGTLVTW